MSWVRRAWPALAGAALAAALAVPLLSAPAARAAGPAAQAPAARHVVIVGISGLRWNQVTPRATPELWRLASGGSGGSLGDYAQQPLACPAHGLVAPNAGRPPAPRARARATRCPRSRRRVAGPPSRRCRRSSRPTRASTSPPTGDCSA